LSQKIYHVGKKCQISGMAVVIAHCSQSRPNQGNFPLVLRNCFVLPTCLGQQVRLQLSVQLLMPCQSWGSKSSRSAEKREGCFGVETLRNTIAIPKKSGSGRFVNGPFTSLYYSPSGIAINYAWDMHRA
jgi:hypothetical protein